MLTNKTIKEHIERLIRENEKLKGNCISDNGFTLKYNLTINSIKLFIRYVKVIGLSIDIILEENYLSIINKEVLLNYRSRIINENNNVKIQVNIPSRELTLDNITNILSNIII